MKNLTILLHTLSIGGALYTNVPGLELSHSPGTSVPDNSFECTQPLSISEQADLIREESLAVADYFEDIMYANW